MGHKLPLIVVLSLVWAVAFCSKIVSAQQAVQEDAARDDSSRPPAAMVWDARTSGDVLTLKGHSNGVVSVAFCQDGERVVSGGADCIACVWDAKTGAQLLKIDNTGFNGCHASVSSDGARILTTNMPYVKLWDAKTGNELLDLTRQVGLESYWPFPFHAAIIPDANQIITAGPVVRVEGVNEFRLKLRDTKTGAELVTLKGQNFWPYCSAFSPDGSQVATGCETCDDSARVWDCKTGAELFALKGHGGSVWSVCFARDGQRLATGGGNGKVHVWDMKTGAELLTLVGHTKAVTGVSFSPDGKRILTGSHDRTARIWDTTTGTELFVLQGHAEFLTDAQFSPDGKRIATASWDKTVRIWDFHKYLDTRPTDGDGLSPRVERPGRR